MKCAYKVCLNHLKILSQIDLEYSGYKNDFFLIIIIFGVNIWADPSSKESY
jgi:hypothetical protein